MLKLWKSKPKALAGIDFSSSSIKCILLTETNGAWTVEKYGAELLPPLTIVEREVKDPQAAVDCLRKLIERLDLASDVAAVIAVAGTSVVSRIIQLSALLDDKEIGSQITVEADRYIPYPLEEAYLDYQVIGPSPKHEDLVDIAVAAARIDEVDARLAVLDGAGLQVAIVDIELYAVERAFQLVAHQLPEQGRSLRIGLIDIGGSLTTLHVLENLRVVYSRDQAFGGQQLVDEIERRYGLNHVEARQAVKLGNLPEDYLVEVLQPFKSAIAQQVTRTLQFFYSSESQGALDYLVLSGGTANIAEIDDIISEKVGIKTLIANPLQNMSIAPHINATALALDAPGLMVCCGLALRNHNDD